MATKSRSPDLGGNTRSTSQGAELDTFAELVQSDDALQTFLASVIDLSLKKFGAKMLADTDNSTVPSVSDVIRLMQLRRELKADEPIREIEVRWVDPSATEFSR
jgi:hypothetical protein